MYPKYNNINLFENSSIIYMRKQQNKIVSYMIILLIGSILFLLIATRYKYTKYNIYYGKVVNIEDNNYIYMTVDSDFIDEKNRNYLEINDKEYKCHLRSVSDNYYVYNSTKYWEVTFNCDLPEEININDNLIEIKMSSNKTTLFKEIIKKIKKGLKNARVKN